MFSLSSIRLHPLFCGSILSLLLLGPLLGFAAPSAPEPFPPGSTPPKVIRQTKPDYPYTMRRLGAGGEVVVSFVVTRDGTTTDIYPVRSNHPAFEEAAVEAIARWRFHPARVNDRTVNARMQVPVIFQVEGSRAEPWTINRPKAFPADIPPEFHWDTPPRLINYSPPVYPRTALLAKQAGKVTVAFVVDTDGHVASRKIVDEALPDLAAASLAAVDTFLFEPARRGDAPGLAVLRMEFHFNPTGRGDVPVSPEDSRLGRLLQENSVQIVPLAELDAAPKPRSRRSPVAPLTLENSGEVGEALIEFIIDHRGFARLPHTLSASHPELGYAAVHAVNTWRFESPRKDGRVVDAVVRIPVKFDLSAPAPSS